MVVSVLSGHNIIKPNSDFTSRPNCYFVLEFDDKNYTSDVVMNSSQPNFNEELEIKINSDEYSQKLNALLIIVSLMKTVVYLSEDVK
jgi:Ca2+-dependent lipid-binding protein